jgi:PIN domain nuclease of toxin-antitoxin system
VKLLVDSHALFWWLTDNPRLSGAAEAAIASRENDVLVSACVGYELVYKQRQGRLSPSPGNLVRRLQRDGFDVLPISLEHALTAAGLPGPHRDPWDRIMMAQAIVEQLQVVTVDKVFSEYGLPVIW